MSIKTHTASALVAATIAAGFVGMHQPAETTQVTTVSAKVQHLTPWMKRPCANEDSVNCFWDAGTSGNGGGHSFYVRQFPGKQRMVCVMYVRARDARRWDYCEATR